MSASGCRPDDDHTGQHAPAGSAEDSGSGRALAWSCLGTCTAGLSGTVALRRNHTTSEVKPVARWLAPRTRDARKL